MARLRFVEVLQDRNFRYYWITNALFFMGTQVQMATRQWLVVGMTSSRTILGLTGFLQGIVMVLLSPTGGVLADRLPKRNILLFGRGALLIVSTIMAALVFTNQIRLEFVMAEALAVGAVMAFAQPATQSYVYDLVGRARLGNAIAFNATGTGLASLIGPSIAGVLIAAAGVAWAYSLSSGGYVIGLVILTLIPVLGQTSGAHRGPFFSELMDGLRLVKSNPALRWLLIASCYSVLGTAVMALRPVYAEKVLDVGPVGYGLMFTFFGAGALVSSVVLASIGLPKRVGIIPPIGAMIWSVVIIVYAFSRSFPLTLACEVVIGAVSAVWPASLMMSTQIAVPDALRSRALSLIFMGMQTTLLGYLLAGGLADAFGDTFALAAPGIVGFPLMLLVLIRAKPLWDLNAIRPEAAVANEASSKV